MKKRVLTVVLLAVSVMLMAQDKTEELKGIHPYKVEENVAAEHAHWSLIPYAGVNIFFGDFNANEALTTFSYPSLGLGVECAFNPAWTLGLEYGFNPWLLKGNPKQVDKTGARLNADTLLLGNAHMVDLYLAADLINLILPFAKKKPVALMAQVGVGGAMHKNSVYYDMSEKNAEGRSARGNTALHPGLRTSMNKYDFNPFLKFGLNLEFNINRTLALGVRAAYNLFLSDMIDGRQFNPNTDGLMDVALNMRFKLMAVSKTHARNVPGRDFPDLRAITTSEAHEYVHKEVAEHVEEAYAAGVEAAKVHDTVIIYHDSVIYRDSIIYRQAATQIAQQQPEDESAAKLAEQKQQPRVYARAARKFYIYFDSDQTELKSEGLISIQQVADLMEEDEELCAVVVGYCDNTGTPESNKELGEKRASVIEEELREEYGIAAGRIYATYGGVVVGRRSSAAYAPNRRVVIELVDKETFKSRQAELGKK